MSLEMPPLIRWPGGQSRTARKLRRFYPKHDTYVEPFAGGASFFFDKDPVPVEVLGDTSPWLIKFYDAVRKGALKKCGKGIPNNAATLRRAQSRKDVCSRMTVSALAFATERAFQKGASVSFNTRSSKRLVYTEKFAHRKDYERRLRHAHLTTGSFDRTMRKFDSPTAFHLLDPPWPDNHSKEYYSNADSEVTPAHVAKVVRSMKGTVWVLYNDHPAVRAAFLGKPGFKTYRIKMWCMHPSRSGQDCVKLLIVNRRLK